MTELLDATQSVLHTEKLWSSGIDSGTHGFVVRIGIRPRFR